MRTRCLETIEALAFPVLMLIPPLGFLLFGIKSLLQRTVWLACSWGVAGLGFGMFALVASILAWSQVSLITLTGHVIIILLAASLLRAKPRLLLVGAVATIGIILCSSFYFHLMSAHGWNASASSVSRESRIPSSDTHSVTGDGGRLSAYRSWRLDRGTEAVLLQFELRLRHGIFGWDWRTASQADRLETLIENSEVITRFSPIGRNPFIFRGISTGSPIAGRTFRATIDLRAADPGEVCGALYLAERGAAHLARKDVCLEPSWDTYTLTWTAPDSAQLPTVDLVLNHFTRGSLDIRRVKLEELSTGLPVLLNPLAPTGVGMALSWSADSPYAQDQTKLKSIQLIPRSNWQRFELHAQDDGLHDQTRIWAELQVERGIAVEIRNVSLQALTPGKSDPRAVSSVERQSLWFQQYNLAGHSILTTGLVLLSATRSGWLGLAGKVLTLVGIHATGSRAAWIAALIGLPWLLWLACRPPERRWVFGLLAVGLVGLATLDVDNLGRLKVLDVDEAVGRTDIWRVALQALREQPWTGIGGTTGDFSDYWDANHLGTSREVVTHAHNLWLAYASSYGVPGLLAILWLTAGFLYIAWRWGRWRGLALVIPVFIMNIFDYTFFYAGVLFPLILGLNSLLEARREDRAGSDNQPRLPNQQRVDESASPEESTC